MRQPILKTPRCILRPSTADDAPWMLKLFNDPGVIAYIEGIKWFNADINSVIGFISAMEVNAGNNMGALWGIMHNDAPIGFIMVNDLNDSPFLTFALFPEYRGQRFGSEAFACVNRYVSENFAPPKTETKNPIVKKILRHKAEILFINDQYFTSLISFKNLIISLDAKKKRDMSLIDDILALFRDGSLLKWLYYLSENGDEEALIIANSVLHILSDEGDRKIFSILLNVFSGNQTYLQKGDISAQVRLCQNATLRKESYETTVNLFRPINVSDELGTDFEIILSFEIQKSSHDVVEVKLNSKSQSLNLGKKRKSVKLSYPISLKDAVEKSYILTLDDEKLTTIVFQMYPPKEWDNERCTFTGVKHLYLQQYIKAKLCFNKFESAADLFWLGIMSYIGCEGIVDSIRALDYFQNASNKEDAKWSCIADCFRALMLIKGEGEPANIFKANEIISKHNTSDSGLSIIKESILGNLKDWEYDNILYAYNVSDFAVIPKTYVEFVGTSIRPFYITDSRTPFKIIVTHDLSSKLAQLNPQTDSLHAHIGVTNNSDDWKHVLTDFYVNTPNNTFIYNSELNRWELDIVDIQKDLNEVVVSPLNERIFKINIILRNSTSEIEIRPTKDTCYNIDCLCNYSHIALCNITPLLLKFECVATICNQIALKAHPVVDTAQIAKIRDAVKLVTERSVKILRELFS